MAARRGASSTSSSTSLSASHPSGPTAVQAPPSATPAPTILAARPAAPVASTLLARGSEAKRLFGPGLQVHAEVFARYTEPLEMLSVALLGSNIERQRLESVFGGEGAESIIVLAFTRGSVAGGQDAWLSAEAAVIMAPGAGNDEMDELGAAALAWSASDLVIYCVSTIGPALLTRLRLIASLASPYMPSSSAAPLPSPSSSSLPSSAPVLVLIFPPTIDSTPSLTLAITAALGASVRAVHITHRVTTLSSLSHLTRPLRRPLVLRDWARVIARSANDLRSGALLNELMRTVL